MKTAALALALALAAPAAAHADYWHVALDSQTHAVSTCFPVNENHPTRTDDGKPATFAETFDIGSDHVVVYTDYSDDFGKRLAHVYTQTEADCRLFEAGKFPLTSNP